MSKVNMQDSTGITCSRCGHVNRVGELSCFACGTLLATGLTTIPLTETEVPAVRSNLKASSTSSGQITLEISGEKVVFSLEDAISLGRIIPAEVDENPCDIDLAP